MVPEFLSYDWIILFGGLALTALIIFTETAFPFGVIIPGGETLLFLSGLLAGTQWVNAKILLVIIPITLFAFIGDLVAYSTGIRAGDKIYYRKERVFFRSGFIKRAEKFLEEFSFSGLIFARFIPVLRTFVPLICGVKEYSYSRYFIFSLLGAIVYINSIILAGFFTGRMFPFLKEYVEIFIGTVLAFVFITPIITLLREKKDVREEDDRY
jgi:membrane-associated protein